MRASRTLPRTALAALVTCAIAVGGGALAWACTPDAVISASPDVVSPGGTVTVHGQGFVAGEPVQIHLGSDGVVGSTTVGDGVWSATVTIPANAAPGQRLLMATAPSATESPATSIQIGPPSANPDPGGSPGGGNGPGPSTPGAVSGGSRGVTGSPGTSSGQTSGGDANADGRSNRSASGGSGSRERIGSATGDGAVEIGSGETVFTDSLGSNEEARGGSSSSKADPSTRSASGDLWSGFASDGKGARGGFADGGVPSNGPGSALTLSLALAGLGLTALMAGAGATALRRRRALARRSSD